MAAGGRTTDNYRLAIDMAVSDLMTQGPLSGIRVVDFGQYVAGPALAMMLADQGAEVIHIDPPDGPMWDSPVDAVLNRNKQRISLDLKDDSDRKIALDLVARADILVENFRPGVMARLGLGADDLTSDHPRLIYLSIPGFASTDPEYAHLQAWEGVIGAATGIFTDQGISRILMKNGEPYYTPLTLASGYATAMAAVAVMTALLHRESTGRGDIVEVPIAAAVMEGLVYNSMVFHDAPDRYTGRRWRELSRRLEAGEPLDMSWQQVHELRDPTYRNYRCADGRMFYNETVGIRRHVLDGLRLHGALDELVAEGMPLRETWESSKNWNEGDFGVGSEICDPWANRIGPKLEKSFIRKTTAEWEELYKEWHLAGAPQQTTEEFLNETHANQSGLIVTVDDPRYGPMKQPGSHAWLKSSAGLAFEHRAAQRPDAGRQSILQSLSKPAEPTSMELRSDPAGLPLAGLRILDLTNVLGGPTISSTLARFGAEVIHVAPTSPSFEPAESVICGAQCGKGKKSILIDLKTARGHQILMRLVRNVDIVTFNGTDEQVERLNVCVGNAQERRIQNVIFCQLSAFDGPAKGPRSERLGYDDLTQALTGVMVRFGGSPDTPDEHAHVGTIDVMGGYLGAFGALLSLYKRGRGGGPDHAKAALLSCAEMIQYPFMYDHEGRAPFDEPSGPDVLGEHALYRLYEASDGWFFLGARSAESSRIADVPELADYPQQAAADREAWLEQIAAWQAARLLATGIDARRASPHTRPIPWPPCARSSSSRKKSAQAGWGGPTFQFLRNEQHPSGYTIDLFGPAAIRMRHAAVRIPSDQPRFGEHSREILTELGFDAADVERLIEDNVVATGWCEQQLPD